LTFAITSGIKFAAAGPPRPEEGWAEFGQIGGIAAKLRLILCLGLVNRIDLPDGGDNHDDRDHNQELNECEAPPSFHTVCDDGAGKNV
jgi:hypothetical protein